MPLRAASAEGAATKSTRARRKQADFIVEANAWTIFTKLVFEKPVPKRPPAKAASLSARTCSRVSRTMFSYVAPSSCQRVAFTAALCVRTDNALCLARESGGASVFPCGAAAVLDRYRMQESACAVARLGWRLSSGVRSAPSDVVRRICDVCVSASAYRPLLSLRIVGDAQRVPLVPFAHLARASSCVEVIGGEVADGDLATHGCIVEHTHENTHTHRPLLPASSCHLCTNELSPCSFPVPYAFPLQTLSFIACVLYIPCETWFYSTLNVMRRMYRLGAKKKTPKEMVRRIDVCVLRIAERTVQQKRQAVTSRVA